MNNHTKFVDKEVGEYVFNTRNKLGQGQYGIVYAGVNKMTNQKVAIKVLDKSQIDEYQYLLNRDEYLRDSLLSEIMIMQQLQSEHTVKLIEVSETDQAYYLIQEYCSGGDLEGYLKKKYKLPEPQAIDILVQILKGFRELIKFGVIHRDLKPANILINKGQYKITDFGFSKSVVNLNILLSSMVGTPMYMCPQLLNFEEYTSKCDIWSIGVMYFKMIFGKYPWVPTSQEDLAKKVILDQWTFPNDPISPDGRAFIKDCLRASENDRISWDKVYAHKYVQKYFQEEITPPTHKYIINDLRQHIIRQKLTVTKLFQQISNTHSINLQQLHMFLRFINPWTSPKDTEELFNILDQNKNQLIEYKELVQWFRANNVLIQQLQIVQDNLLQSSSHHTKRKSHIIVQKSEEVIKHLIDLIKNKTVNFNELFDKFDSSKDGKLDQREISDLALSIDPSLSAIELQTIFFYFDINKDGLIGRDEFHGMLRSQSEIEETAVLTIHRLQESLPGPGSKLLTIQQQYR